MGNRYKCCPLFNGCLKLFYLSRALSRMSSVFGTFPFGTFLFLCACLLIGDR